MARASMRVRRLPAGVGHLATVAPVTGGLPLADHGQAIPELPSSPTPRGSSGPVQPLGETPRASIRADLSSAAALCRCSPGDGLPQADQAGHRRGRRRHGPHLPPPGERQAPS